MRSRTVLIAFLATILVSAPALAADTCHERSTQFGKLRHCVTSVRAPQGGASYGPDNIAATGENSWCAAAENTGGAQTITLYQEPVQTIRTLTIASGFEKSDNAARQGRRIKRAMIETDRGYRGTVTLKDTATSQKVIIAKARVGWIRLTILETYPSNGHSGVCVNEFLSIVEEFANN